MSSNSYPVERPLGPREQAMVAAATRVGLADEPGVIRKALELDRLLATRFTSGGGFSDTCRNVLCLDLSSTVLDVPADKAAIIKNSGMKKSAYLSVRGAAEGLLQMRSLLSVSGVCIKLQCVSSQPVAEKILAEYRKTQEIDPSNPQYVCMAVHQACRITKTRVSKAKLMTLSGLKPNQWAKLESSWEKFVDEKYAKDKSGKKIDQHTLLSKCVDDIEMNESSVDKVKQISEDYETWRKRVLTEAYRELRELERKNEGNKSETAQRKSPRKRNDVDIDEDDQENREVTPRKSPRKKDAVSPAIDRSKGVRLLFH